MPRNPDQDRDRSDEQAQAESQSQPKIWPKNPDQQDKAGSDRSTNPAESSGASAERVPGKDEHPKQHQTSREEDEDIAKKMSESGDEGISKGGGG